MTNQFTSLADLLNQNNILSVTLLCTCIMAFVSYIVWRIYQHKLQRESEYHQRLEQDVQIRTQELAKRHDELMLLNQRFLKASVTDALTGLRNRRYVFEEAAKDIEVVKRNYKNNLAVQSDFVFLMIDLDDFKSVNNIYGHSAGDELLLQVRDLMQSTCRSSDAIIRWGGDEFLVIGRYSDLHHGDVLAERIRSKMEQVVFFVDNGQAVRTSVSIGISGFPFSKTKPDLLDWEQVLSLADTAMHRAKAQGNAWVSIVSTPQSDNVINPFYSFKDHTDAMITQGTLKIRRSFDQTVGDAAEK